MIKKIVFITGTRADYGKIKALMKIIEDHENCDLHIFATGMHLLSKYGSTYKEIEKDKFSNIYKYINQNENSHMDIALSNTIIGFSNYVAEIKPDLIIVHGDRLEALAGALVGAFNNIKVAHIEGGEVSGTIDESIRHSITKFSHIHLVSNEDAKRRIIQLGEKSDNIFIIGSPDIDIMMSDNLPDLFLTKKHYGIEYEKYSILMYHPTTTEIHILEKNIKEIVDAIIESNLNYIAIYPNNDPGNEIILKEYERFKECNNVKVFPSIRFEYFLTLLKHCEFMIGNSSTGVMETCMYGIPSIDIGNRQKNRYNSLVLKNILHVDGGKQKILKSIKNISKKNKIVNNFFGDGKSSEKFKKILDDDNFWNIDIEKNFVDM